MNILLLTHERELNKPTNTGSIALQNSDGVIERILWQRKNPSRELVKLIDNNDALLLYPGENEKSAKIEDYENIIIIDGTWQESRKIYNKSAYLKRAPKVTLKIADSSVYQLRRNQVPGGLCTMECVIEVLKIKGYTDQSMKLENEILQFNKTIEVSRKDT